MTDPLTAREAFADLNPDVEARPSNDPHRHQDAQEVERLRALGSRVAFAEWDENLTSRTERAEVVAERQRAAHRIATNRERGVER